MSEERDRLVAEFEKNINYVFSQPTNVEVEAAFCAGYDAGVESERKKAKGLVEALEFYADPHSKTYCSNDYEKKARQALAAYKQESEACICGEINARHCPIHSEGV